jgi:hypothetical protein
MPASMNSEPRSLEDDQAPGQDLTSGPPVSRRGFGKRLFLSATALAVTFAAGKRDTAQAAPATDPWRLGGNSISTNGTNFLGTTNVAPIILKTTQVAGGTPAERMRITPAGLVGIGTTAPLARLQVHSATYAIYGRHVTAAGAEPGVLGDTLATAAGASGVRGIVRSTTPGADSAGVRGVNNGTGSDGFGVYGSHAGSGSGVHGISSGNGYGVSGDGGFNGVYGKGGSYGVIGSSSSGTGVYGGGVTGLYGSGSTYGVQAFGSSYGVQAFGSSYGVYATGNTFGVYARGTTGVYGTSSSGAGVHGSTTEVNSSAVYGSGGQYAVRGGGNPRTAGVRGDSGYVGVWGEGGTFGGVYGVATATSGQNYGVFGLSNSPAGFGGYFKGRVHVEGILSKGGGSFKIDHPLDPDNKYLSHSFVESPDMMNVYNGNVTLEANGTAEVTLPDWFEALNRDFRYQLTAVGAPGPNLHVAEEIAGNRFKIAGGRAGMKVSWQVTGIRQDAFANANRIPVEEDKLAEERGQFLHPEAFGKSPARGMARAMVPHAPPEKLPAATHPEPVKPEVAIPPREPGTSQ